jgi:hypothetical protein
VIGRATVDSRGGAWGDTGRVVYSTAGNIGLLKMESANGTSEPMYPEDSSGEFRTARWPDFLPGGRHVLFQIRHADPQRKGIYAGAVDGSSPRRIVDNDFGAKYAAGHLLYLRGAALVAQPFDAATSQLTGSSAVVAHPVAGGTTGYGAFSASATGVLAYAGALLAPAGLQWIDRGGRALEPLATAADYVDFRLSPDGSRLAVSRTAQPSEGSDIWILDLHRGTESRVTSDSLTDSGVQWSPSGDQVIFRSNRDSANLQLFRARPDAGARAEVFWSSTAQQRAHGGNPSNVLSTDWSPDGKFIIYHVTTADSGYDLWAFPVDGNGQPIPVARGRHNELQGAVSPDGRWIAYASDESGVHEVYVQSFPDPNAAQRTTVSSDGGTQPRWRADGRELFYMRPDGTLMAVPVRSQRDFVPGAAIPLFKSPLPAPVSGYRMDYVPAADGQRFVMKVPVDGALPPSITVVLNWPALLQK